MGKLIPFRRRAPKQKMDTTEAPGHTERERETNERMDLLSMIYGGQLKKTSQEKPDAR